LKTVIKFYCHNQKSWKMMVNGILRKLDGEGDPPGRSRPPVVKKFQKAYSQPLPPPRNDTIPQNTQQFYTTKPNPLYPFIFSPNRLFIYYYFQTNWKGLFNINNNPSSTIFQFNTLIRLHLVADKPLGSSEPSTAIN
jgi:hypothetical protein